MILFVQRNSIGIESKMRFQRTVGFLLFSLLFVAASSLCAGQESGSRQFHIFPIRHKSAAQIEEVLRPLLPDDPNVQLVVDSGQNQLLVSGGDNVKRIVARFLEAVDIPVDPNNQPTVEPASPIRDELEIYKVPAEYRSAIMIGIERRFGRLGAKIQAGPQENSIFVMGTPALQAEVRGMIDQTLRQLDGNFEQVDSPIYNGNATGNRFPRTDTIDRPAIKEPAGLSQLPPGLRSNLENATGDFSQARSMSPREANGRFGPNANLQNDGQRSLEPQTSTNALSRFFPVSGDAMEKTQREVLFLFDRRLSVDPRSNGLGFLIDFDDKGSLSFQFDFQRQGVLVAGEAGLVDQFGRLIFALSQPQPARGQRSQVIRLQRDAHTAVRDVLSPARADQTEARPNADSNTGPNTGPNAGPNTNNTRLQPRAMFASNALASNSSQRSQLNRSMQDPVQGSGVPSGNPLSPDNPGQETTSEANNQDDQERRALQQFEGVEIDSLPDLDVIILRGRDQELEQLAEIIRQLEQISRDTQAEIRIFNLRHTSSSRIEQILSEANETLNATRQGRVSVTALEKPNSLLLIGWGDAVTATVELIRKLDIPVAPNTQFEVFRLRHALAADVQQTVQSFLQSRQGLGPQMVSTVDARTNSLIVYAAPRDLEEVSALITRLDTPTTEFTNRARIFPIRNSLAAEVAATLNDAIEAATNGQPTALELMIPAQDGRQMLRSGILEDIRISVDTRNNSLLVAGPQESFDLIEALILQLDTPGITAKIKIFPVLNGDAASMVETLRSLLPSQSNGTLRPQLSSAPQETSLAPLRFTVDIRSNSIIATGSEGDLKIVEALILRLDEQDAMQRKSMVYQLKNSPAIDVALAVNEFLRNKRIVEDARPGEINPFQQIEKEVVVVPEPVSNKLILSATPRYFEEIEQLIERLDEQPPEVIIQVLIAEITLNEADEFGIELGVQDSVLFDRSLLGELLTTTNTSQFSQAAGVTTATQEIIQAATNTPGFDFNSINSLGNSGSELARSGAGDVGGQGISNFSVGRSNNELGFGGLVLSASSQNVSVLIRALQESRRLEVLSRPQVRTLDNQPAFIQVGQRVPRIVSATVNQNGQSNNVELENVGLILGVTPRISPDGNVVMEIDAEKSNLGPEQEGIPVSVSLDGTVIRSPRVDTTTAQASVSAASGETIVLGGLITKSTQDIHRKVPFLGDLPLINPLFRFDSVIERRTELLIILTPHVIRSATDSERIKQTEIARMSWCAADVYDIHGDINFAFPEDQLLNMDWDTDVIYPDVDPSGGNSSRRQPSPPSTSLAPEISPSDRRVLNDLESPLEPIRNEPQPFLPYQN